jgi:hypothetical protein
MGPRVRGDDVDGFCITQTHGRLLAAPLPEVCLSLSPSMRGQGMPDARCTRGLACKGWQEKAHTSIQVQRRTSDIPCAMALRLIRALPGELRSVATVACEPVRKLGASLAAPGPHDFAVRFDTARQRCRRVHRIPSQRSVTIANAPSQEDRMAGFITVIWVSGKAKFYPTGYYVAGIAYLTG